MNSEENLVKIKEFLNELSHNGRTVKFYKKKENPKNFFKEVDIKVDLDAFKEIILEEDTSLELGGPKRTSFLIIYPLKDSNLLNNGNIVIIGPEIKDISDTAIDFGIIILIGINSVSEQTVEQFRDNTIISNGIEGFMIRTIPRRFWCRISSNIISKFSFEFLANAIIYLYDALFGNLIKSIEIILINSELDIINSFIDMTSTIQDEINLNWKEKVIEWKRRIDCNFDWKCNECPYYEVCEDIEKVLKRREVLD